MDNVKLAHSLDMGVFCISPNDKGGKLYKPSKVGHDVVVVLHFFFSMTDWFRSSAHVVRLSIPSRNAMFLLAHTHRNFFVKVGIDGIAC